MRHNRLGIGLLIFGLIQTFSVTNVNAQSKADKLRAIERERLRSLVDADIATARRLHADDFDLIHPKGGTLSKGRILEAHRVRKPRLPRVGSGRNSSQDVSRLGCYSFIKRT
jgi:hypothetical protein